MARTTERRAGRLEAEFTEHTPARQYLSADEIYARRQREVEHAMWENSAPYPYYRALLLRHTGGNHAGPRPRFHSYPPGTLHATYLAFMRAVLGVPAPPRRPLLSPTAAAVALADDPRFLTFSFESPEAAEAFRGLRREHGNREAARILREDIFVEAILQAQADCKQPQRIRLRKHFLKTRDGLAVPFVPADLPPDFHHDWLRKEAYRIAEARLASMLVAPLPPDDLLALGRSENPRDCGLESLVDLKDAGEDVFAAERVASPFYGHSAPVGRFVGRLSAEDRTLLRLRDRGASYAEIGAALGISRPAAKMRAYRLNGRRQP
jgi:hypothetical protein